ncbi:MAG: hypothetical protein KAS40_22850, partial [Desulfobacterales bacterium]|nr:hypothetical protein [Desulfobacterales bacterium]
SFEDILPVTTKVLNCFDGSAFDVIAMVLLDASLFYLEPLLLVAQNTHYDIYFNCEVSVSSDTPSIFEDKRGHQIV